MQRAVLILVLGLGMFLLASGQRAAAFQTQVIMKDGRILEGKIGQTDSVAENPQAGKRKAPVVDVERLVIVDDGLRRTFVPEKQVREARQGAPRSLERITIRQPVADGGYRIGSIGASIRVSPFDKFGRRTFEIQTADGAAAVVQGITEITPVYTKVQGLRQEKRSYVWDMRIATSSIPTDILNQILRQTLKPNDLTERLKIVRLYAQSDRFNDAHAELAAILKDFPEEKALADEVRALRQIEARRLLAELEMRKIAGQYAFVAKLLKAFPQENVAGETLERVREIQQDYATTAEQGRKTIELVDQLIGQLDPSPLQARLAPFRDELQADLNFNTLPRMGAFLRLADDDKLGAPEKLAIAVSGWLLGSNAALENLPVALNLYDARDLVRRYLNEPTETGRTALLEAIRASEGGMQRIAQLLANLKPPVPTEPQEGAAPGSFRLQIASPIPGEPDVVYHVQLPPEYDPYRRYPTVVTLNGNNSTAEQQISWWAGDFSEKLGQRMGQATRLGYIVVAVDWRKPHQEKYEYSVREHTAVLGSLRDAIRRFSIDTDRVFLSGHGSGGNAAWDIALAHPDLWAGVIPIVAVGEKFVDHYWENVKYVPFYLVAGELDGGKMMQNGRNLDRYQHHGYDATVVEYLGRGHEHFYEEIPRLFDWMGRRRRDFYPREFICDTMRTFDNFFWWVEAVDFPTSTMVEPANWPPPRPKPATVKGNATKDTIFVSSGAARMTIWLSPNLVDLEKPFVVRIGDRRLKASDAQINLTVLLEDARTRGDRQHPFWGKIVYPVGR